MDNAIKNYYTVGNATVLCLLIAGVFFLSLWIPNSATYPIFSSPAVRCPNNQPSNNSAAAAASTRDDLAVALEKASAGSNKTAIIAVVNKAYVEGDDPVNMLDLFLESFWHGEGTRPLISRLLTVAVDQTAYERCLFRGLLCYLLPGTDGRDTKTEMVYMSKDFINMMWRRTLFLLNVLERGYNFIFTDTDVMWLRNPFTRLNMNLANDIQFSTDRYSEDLRSNSSLINTGFYFVKSNNKTISLFKRWYAMKDNSTGLKEQDVLQNLIHTSVLSELNLVPTFLETRYFSGFCEDSTDIHSVITVHANCCRFISAKLRDLTRMLKDWKRFKSMQPNETTSFKWSRHINCYKSWKN